MKLIEVIVGLFLLGFSLLGLDVLSIRVSQAQQKAWYFTVLSNQMQSLSERLSIDHPKDFAKIIQKWNQQNVEILPSGEGTVMIEDQQYEISLCYRYLNAEQICRNEILPI